MALLCVGVGAVAVISSNALFDQSERHPAPIFGAAEELAVPVRAEAPLVASHSAADPGDELVRKIQAGLRAKGLYAGATSGVLDDETRAAISALETERGLPATGEPSLGLLAAVSAPRPADVTRVREVSTSSPSVVLSVRDVQAVLNDLGYGPLAVDGVLGPRSRKALDDFAQSKGISERGMVPSVLRALAEARG
ncbi:MAG: peptidoglycan-binding protein [Pseudomonadota bacterium]